MKIRLLAGLLIVSLGLNLGVVFSWFHMRGIGKFPRESSWHKKFFIKKLNLSDEQAVLLEKNRAEMKASMDSLKGQTDKKRELLFNIVKSETQFTPEIEKLINDIAVLQIEMERNIIKHSLYTRSQLNPEQQEKFNKFMERGFKKMARGHGPGPR